MKRRWVFAVLMVGLLAAGATGGAVLAHNNGGPQGESRFGQLSSRVAAILGLDEETVQDAFEQAARQIRDEAVLKRLNRLVEDRPSNATGGRRILRLVPDPPRLPSLRTGTAPIPGHGRHGLRGHASGSAASSTERPRLMTRLRRTIQGSNLPPSHVELGGVAPTLQVTGPDRRSGPVYVLRADDSLSAQTRSDPTSLPDPSSFT